MELWRIALLSVSLVWGTVALYSLAQHFPISGAIPCLALVLTGISRPGGSPKHNAHWAVPPKIWHYIESLRIQAKIPGVSFGVVRFSGSELPELDFSTWGLKTEDGDPVSPDTLYSIGSCSKAFVATSVGLLIDDFASGCNRTALPPSVDNLTWDTKIASLLPTTEWRLQDAYATEKASLRDLLSHLSGVPRHDLAVYPDEDTIDVLKRMRFLKSTEIREKMQYSNQMYSVVAYIITKYSGQPFTEFVHERIFYPLNMTDSTYDPVRAEQSGKLSHAWAPNGRRVPFWRSEVTGDTADGPGGINSNTIDMTKWVATMINGGVDPWANTSVIPKSVVDEITTSRTIMDGRGSPDVSIQGYGLGWGRLSYRGHEIVGHNGGITGFNTVLLYLPWDKIGIIGFGSVDGSALALGIAAYNILDHLLGLPPSIHAESTMGSTTGDTSAHTAAYLAEHARGAPVLQRDTVRADLDSPVSCNRNSAAELPVPLEGFAGTYQNFGYGGLKLCAPTSTSAYCTDVLSAFASIPSYLSVQHSTTMEDGESNQAHLSFENSTKPFATLLRPGLYGRWPRWISSHIALFALADPTDASQNGTDGAASSSHFVITLPSLYPHGYGLNTTPFASYLAGLDGSLGWLGPRAECKLVNGIVTGCGFLEGFLSDEDQDQSIEERAVAWFAKL
ncbi:hypothetical protein CERSUDRAFT_118507 [Gelatoporia subvermispora B]|uniref:Beta-lactamase-related domain-containing protein n=1 Tax=Ceriporiopsis subvermispora (strain B) TaxID=914234 RepID=M2R1N9_CERS8|nr:hypothetical protein CERSUDRAFT_118507 [Gelatoporia subvermispora B]